MVVRIGNKPSRGEVVKSNCPNKQQELAHGLRNTKYGVAPKVPYTNYSHLQFEPA